MAASAEHDQALAQVWIARNPTYLKSAEVPGIKLADDDKLAVKQGTHLKARLVSENAVYWKVADGTLNGQPLAPHISAVFKAHWTLVTPPVDAPSLGMPMLAPVTLAPEPTMEATELAAAAPAYPEEPALAPVISAPEPAMEAPERAAAAPAYPEEPALTPVISAPEPAMEARERAAATVTPSSAAAPAQPKEPPLAYRKPERGISAFFKRALAPRQK